MIRTIHARRMRELILCYAIVHTVQLITEALCDPGLRESEVPDLQDQLAGVVASIVKTAGPMLAQKDDSCFRLFWVLSHLLASSSTTSVAYKTVCYFTRPFTVSG